MVAFDFISFHRPANQCFLRISFVLKPIALAGGSRCEVIV